jgi:two-component system sensor histidine kinase/response regulator
VVGQPEKSHERVVAWGLRDLGERGQRASLAFFALLALVTLGSDELMHIGWPMWAPLMVAAVASSGRLLGARWMASGREEGPGLGYRLYGAGSVLVAASWAVATAVAMAHLELQPGAVMMVVASAAVAAGGLASLAHIHGLLLAWLGLITGGVAVGAANFWGHLDGSGVIVGGSLVFGAYLVATGRQAGKDYWDRLHAQSLLEERTQALEEARHIAEEAARAKSEFLASMSHEIRTPMNGVLGVADLLRDTPMNPEQQELLRTLESSGQDLLRIINDILDFSKAEAGHLELEHVAFDLAESGEQVAELMATRAQAKGVELDLWLDPRLPRQVMGDPGRVRQILLNLASNAVKFTDAGSVQIELERTGGHGDLVDVRFTVRDTGPGIPQTAQKRLFRAFSQLDASINRRHGGTGLGLAICRQLVGLMHGHIGFQSEVGRGSAFWFDLRLPTHPGSVELPFLARSRAMVVGGRNEGRVALQRSLACVGVDAAVATTLSEAVGSPPLDVVFLDVGPHDQHLFLELGRLRAAHPKAQVVAVVTAASRADVRAAHGAALQAVLSRPVRRTLLARVLTPDPGQGDGVDASPPLIAAPPPPPPPRSAPPTPVSAGTAAARPRVLVVEDNPVNQMLARRFLARAGFESGLAADGHEGLEALGEGHWDAILMDCQMPGMDGIEATVRIRQAEQATGRHIPIVAMTAHAMEEDRRRALDAGMDAYLTKPIQPQEMERVLQQLIAKGAA